jgi:hypothetical protein
MSRRIHSQVLSDYRVATATPRLARFPVMRQVFRRTVWLWVIPVYGGMLIAPFCAVFIPFLLVSVPLMFLAPSGIAVPGIWIGIGLGALTVFWCVHRLIRRIREGLQQGFVDADALVGIAGFALIPVWLWLVV